MDHEERDPGQPVDPNAPATEPVRDPTQSDGEVPPAEAELAPAEAQLPPRETPPPAEAEAFDAPRGAAAAERATEAETAAHAVPATGVGESTLCPRCGTENRPGLAFCRNCGQRLIAAGVAATLERPATPDGTVACPRCGTHNRAGVTFCQNCGANLRAAQGAPTGYVPPAVVEHEEAGETVRRGGAILGPVVLLIGAIGIAAAWLLPFAFGSTSLYERAAGPGGYGPAFWSGLSAAAGVTDKLYLALGAAAPVLVALLLVLVIAGLFRAAAAPLQLTGLLVVLVWALGLAALFVVVELLGGPSASVSDRLRALSPGGIIFFLASLILIIGVATRLARS
ncbi:MAG: zinc ribbon domain-containing protein [Chloroflexota bacterium]|nr:zinc ribbon domain-containing protein [Chloroflexota bacterium]